MNKYMILYWVVVDEEDKGSFNHSYARIPYKLNNSSLVRLEHKLKKSLQAIKVKIISYKLIESGEAK